jgi:hypothetical protein
MVFAYQQAKRMVLGCLHRDGIWVLGSPDHSAGNRQANVGRYREYASPTAGHYPRSESGLARS